MSRASYLRETNINLEKQIFFFISLTAIQNKILQQTKIPITIPYKHSINIYHHNNLIQE